MKAGNEKNAPAILFPSSVPYFPVPVEKSSYLSLLSDPLAGSKLGRENNTFGRSGARLCL